MSIHDLTFERRYPDSIEEHTRHEEQMERRAEAIGRYRRQQFELFELESEWPECPNCGERAQPVSFDCGRSSETGYHDAGEGCTKCTNVRSR